jgi:LmbE family N-acetylglucosaminyl deacetylase
LPEAELTTAVDVSDVLDAKRASFASHASQETDTAFFLRMTPEVFRRAFGMEWFRREGAPAGLHEDWLAGLTRDG